MKKNRQNEYISGSKRLALNVEKNRAKKFKSYNNKRDNDKKIIKSSVCYSIRERETPRKW